VGNPTGLEAKVVRAYPWIRFLPLSSQGLDRRRPWTWPATALAAARALAQAKRTVRRFRPDVAFGTGGHVAFAPLVGALLSGVPMVIHEQNARMGLANRVLSPWAALVLLSFPETEGVPRRARTLLTGNPVRREIVSLSPELGDELLVVGGSRGARPLVDAVLRAAPDLARTPGLRVRLVVGNAAPPEAVERALGEAGVEAEVVPYADPFAEALKRARLVVARAGATTAAELAAAGRPAVLVPWPGAADLHQHENARALARAGGGVVLPEEVALHKLAEVVCSLWTDEARLSEMARAARAVARPEAARRAAEALITLVNKEKRS